MLVVLPLIMTGACESAPEEAAESQSEIRIDPAEYEGLSREEIEAQAEAMTLEEAESLGIVDTTIRIEPPVNPDSVLPFPIDTGAGG